MAARLTLKNSDVQFKNATTAQLSDGELGLNYHSSGPYLQVKDSNGAIVSVGGTYFGAEAPLNPIRGRQWVDTSTNDLYIYNTSWVGPLRINFIPEAETIEALQNRVKALEEQVASLIDLQS